MEKFVEVAVNRSKLTWPSFTYIHKSDECKIKCNILNQKIGCFKDYYKLKLIGNPNNIDTFLSYLKMEGFQVTTF